MGLSNKLKNLILSALGSPEATDELITAVETDSGAGALQANGSVPMTGNLDANGNTIVNLADPVSNQDAATKAYVLAHIGGGTVTNVTATGPITSTGGATPNIAIPIADATHTGALTSTDWNRFNSDNDPTENVDYHIVTAPEASIKQFSLSAMPLNTTEVVVDIISGGPQYYGVDFTISGNVFNWGGLALDGLLNNGDIVRCHYLS